MSYFDRFQLPKNATKERPRIALQSVLPEVSLVPFEAKRVAKPNIVWASKSSMTRAELEDFAYCIPFDGESADTFRNETRSFLGERYGGSGAVCNGGGVRCGEYRGVAIKGIGRNPLAGAGSDFFHSYGGASLNESVVEAVWGEVSNIALPYGGLRVLAIITTGTRVPLLGAPPDRDPTTPRALILRPAVPRPAHYMRSIFYRPLGEMQRQPSDVVRTRTAVQSIGRAFAALYGNAPANPEDPQYLNQCLLATFKRCATQIAAARAKRIMHSSLTDSNLTLDGVWLDFATATTVSDYGRIYSAPLSPDFLSEEQTLGALFADLPFYLRKYLPAESSRKLLSAAQLQAHFQRHFQDRLFVEFLKISGVSEERLRPIDMQLKTALFDVMTAIRQSGNNRIYPIWSDDPRDPLVMPEKTGDYHLNTIMQQIAFCGNEQEAELELASSLPNPVLRRRLADVYMRFRAAYLRQFGPEQRSHAQLFLSVNAFRVNAVFPALYRPTLYRNLDQVIQGGGDVSAFIDDLVVHAKTLLADVEAGKIDLRAWFDTDMVLTEQSGFVANGKPTTFGAALEHLRPGILSARQVAMLRDVTLKASSADTNH